MEDHLDVDAVAVAVVVVKNCVFDFCPIDSRRLVEAAVVATSWEIDDSDNIGPYDDQRVLMMILDYT